MTNKANNLKLIITQCRTCSYITSHVGKVDYMAKGIPRCTMCEEAIKEAQDVLSSLGDIGDDIGGLL